MATSSADGTGRSGARAPRWRRAAVLALALPLLTPLLAACGAGFDAQTSQLYQPGPGLEVRSGDIYIMNAVIVTNGSSNGTLVAAFMNQRRATDTLESVTAKSSTGKTLTVTILPGHLSLPDGKVVQVADTADIRVHGPLDAGTIAKLVFTFHNAAPVKLDTPVVSRNQQFRTIPVGPIPTPVKGGGTRIPAPTK